MNYPDGTSTKDIDKHLGSNNIYPQNVYIVYTNGKRNESMFYTFYNDGDMKNAMAYMKEKGYIVKSIKKIKKHERD